MKAYRCRITLFAACLMMAGCLFDGAVSAGSANWFVVVFVVVPETEPSAALPMDEDTDGCGWRLGPDLSPVHDEALGRNVWEHSGGRSGWIRSSDPLPDSFMVEARVRVMGQGHGVALGIGAEGRDDRPRTAYSMRIRPTGERSWRIDTARAGRDRYLEDTKPAGGRSGAAPSGLHARDTRQNRSQRALQAGAVAVIR